jgi:Vps4 C terminal oligomerisation domain
MNAISRDLNDPKIEYQDFVSSIKNIKPIITQNMIDYFEGFAEKIKL